MKMEDIKIGDGYDVGNHPVYGPWVVTVIATGSLKVFCAYRQHSTNEYREDVFTPNRLSKRVTE